MRKSTGPRKSVELESKSCGPVRLILASQSEARRRLLLRLGFSFETIPSNIDEYELQIRYSDPRQIVRSLARAKAQHVFDSHVDTDGDTKVDTDVGSRHALRDGGTIVIGSDQILTLNTPAGVKILGKPITAAGARRQLKICSGQKVKLITGVHLEGVLNESGLAPMRLRKTWVHEVKMQFRNLSPGEIREYVRLDQPLQCAGSFKFEEHGISLFSQVATDDPTSIEGLPLLSLNQELLKLV